MKRKEFENIHGMYVVRVNKYDETLDFDTLVNQIEFYNCNSESGNYLKYYIIADSER